MAEKEYIEREALLNEIEETRPLNWTDTAAEITEQADYDLFEILVKSQPTADVQEVRHGKNITKINPVDEFECSECGFICEMSEIYYDDENKFYTYRDYNPKFCPNCGAKMDKE